MLIEKHTKDSIDTSLIRDIIKSFNNYYEINNYKEDIGSKDIEELWRVLPSDSLYTVIKDNRFLGFFINTNHKSNEEISFQIFLSPIACPKSNISLIKAAMANTFILFTQSPNTYKHLEFISGHPLLVTAVKTMLSKMTSYTINPNHIVCYKEIEEPDLIYMKAFINSYIKTKNNNNYNSYELLR